MKWTMVCAVAIGALAGCGDSGGGGVSDATGDALTGDSLGGDALVDTTGGGPAPVVDPGCIDGQYVEALPPADADISGLKSAYSAAGYKQFVLDVLGVRYPVGRWIVDNGLQSDAFGGQDCVDTFIGDKSSAAGVIRQLSTLVHECGHFYDIDLGFFDANYAITPDLTLKCQGGGAPQNGGAVGQGQTFARSRINGDDWAALRPACVGFGGSGCDFYANTYLDGDPDDATFDGGDQGFDSLLEETVQYVNSLATGYAFADHYSGSVSERDGILTFLWYVERYLQLARTDYPEVYQRLSQNACWQQAILTVWGRAWTYLDATEGNGALGLDDGAIEQLVLEPELLGEIGRIRQAAGCGG